jgi:hypothetical protein
MIRMHKMNQISFLRTNDENADTPTGSASVRRIELVRRDIPTGSTVPQSIASLFPMRRRVLMSSRLNQERRNEAASRV